MKYTYIFYAFFIYALITSSIYIYTNTGISSDINTELELEDYSNFDYEEWTKDMDENNTDIVPKGPAVAESFSINPLFAVEFLKRAGIPDLLKEALIEHTNSPNGQSLQDRPLIGRQFTRTNKKRITGWDFFYNQMSRGFFTKKSTSLNSYININGASLINRIQCCLEKVRDLFGNHPSLKIDAEKILNLFCDIKLQERQCGLFFSHAHSYRDFIARIKVPFYYFERNLYLDHQEREAIAEQFGQATPEETARFRKLYFVSDKCGFGDLRIELEKSLQLHHEGNAHIGIYSTIPTAFALHKGFLGSSFNKPSTLPDLLLFEKLFEIVNESSTIGNPERKALDIVKNFALDSAKRVAAALLDTELGNNGHLGIGLFGNTAHPLQTFISREWAAPFTLINKVSAEYLFPAKEKRFFIRKKNPADIQNHNFTNPDQNPVKATADLRFIEQQVVNTFFMVAYDTWVQPGIIFHGNHRLCYQGNTWGGQLGIDNWLQTKGALGDATIPQSCHTIPKTEIDFNKAKPFLAFRSNALASFNYQIVKPTWILDISCGIDGSLWSSGIGKDFTLLFKIESHY